MCVIVLVIESVRMAVRKVNCTYTPLSPMPVVHFRKWRFPDLVLVTFCFCLRPHVESTNQAESYINRKLESCRIRPCNSRICFRKLLIDLFESKLSHIFDDKISPQNDNELTREYHYRKVESLQIKMVYHT